jgi:hypothetical protein
METQVNESINLLAPHEPELRALCSLRAVSRQQGISCCLRQSCLARPIKLLRESPRQSPLRVLGVDETNRAGVAAIAVGRSCGWPFTDSLLSLPLCVGAALGPCGMRMATSRVSGVRACVGDREPHRWMPMSWACADGGSRRRENGAWDARRRGASRGRRCRVRVEVAVSSPGAAPGTFSERPKTGSLRKMATE